MLPDLSLYNLALRKYPSTTLERLIKLCKEQQKKGKNQMNGKLSSKIDKKKDRRLYPHCWGADIG